MYDGLLRFRSEGESGRVVDCRHTYAHICIHAIHTCIYPYLAVVGVGDGGRAGQVVEGGPQDVAHAQLAWGGAGEGQGLFCVVFRV